VAADVTANRAGKNSLTVNGMIEPAQSFHLFTCLHGGTNTL